MRRSVFAVLTALAVLCIAPFTQLGYIHGAQALVATNLSMNVVAKNVQWGYYVTVTGKLSDAATGDGIGDELLTFDGTGGTKMTRVITNSDGFFIATGIAPDSVSTKWTIKAHFAGDSTYGASNSNKVTYNTVKHGAKLTLQVSPAMVNSGDNYDVSGTLIDALTNQPIDSATISFTAELPVSISDTTTDSSGEYSVNGLTAPSEGFADIYDIRAHFDGNLLFRGANSKIMTLSVLEPDTYEPNDDISHLYDLGSIPQDVGPLEFAPNMHSTSDEDWFVVDAMEKGWGEVDELNVEISLSNIPAGSNYDLYVQCPTDCDTPSFMQSSVHPGNSAESVSFSKPDSVDPDEMLLVIEVRNVSNTASASSYTLTITVS